jgi:cytoskeletal protein CcmA (bactofilin family)
MYVGSRQAEPDWVDVGACICACTCGSPFLLGTLVGCGLSYVHLSTRYIMDVINPFIFFMKKFFTSVVLGSLLLVPFATSASMFAADEIQLLTSDNTIEENVYLAGASVVVSADIVGDLFVAGSTVSIGTDVDGDVFVVGADVDITGDISGDLRLASGNVRISGNIGGELLIAGGLVQILPSSTIGGDIHAAGGEVHLNGDVEGSVLAYSEKFVQAGSIAGDLNANVAEELVLKEGSQVAGSLQYRAPAELENTDQVAGEVVYDGQVTTKSNAKDFSLMVNGVFTLFFIVKALGLLLAAILFVVVLPKLAQSHTKKSLKGFWSNVISGLGVAIIVPILAVLLMVTGVGSMLSAILIGSYALASLCAGIMASVVFGFWVQKNLTKKSNLTVTWVSALVGVLLLGALGLVPVIGWLFVFIWWLSSMGVIWASTQKWAQSNR